MTKQEKFETAMRAIDLAECIGRAMCSVAQGMKLRFDRLNEGNDEIFQSKWN